jgi:ATP-binding cassette, subfamily G (WHITE), member 2, SNQ2
MTAGTASVVAPPMPASCAPSITSASNFDDQVHSLPRRKSSDHTTVPDAENGDPEKRQRSLHRSISDGLEQTESVGVDVHRAEEEFAQLNRQFSAYSERGRRLSRQQSRLSSKIKTKDVEKAVSSDDVSEEPWDLETTLRGAKAADREAGIKAKRIGA